MEAHLKIGYVFSFDDAWVDCLLSKEYELDEELSIQRKRLTDAQEKKLEKGSIIRYNKTTRKIQFRDDGNWV